MKLFLRWEIDYFLNTLGQKPAYALHTDVLLQLALANGIQLKVNEARAGFLVGGVPVGPHPDSIPNVSQGVTADRGNAMIGDADVVESTDATIPAYVQTNAYPVPQ